MNNTLTIDGSQYQFFHALHYPSRDNENQRNFASSLDIESFVSQALELGLEAEDMLADLCRMPLTSPTPVGDTVIDAIAQGLLSVHRLSSDTSSGGMGGGMGSGMSRSNDSNYPSADSHISVPADAPQASTIYSGKMRDFVRHSLSKQQYSSNKAPSGNTPAHKGATANTSALPTGIHAPQDNLVPQHKITVEIAGRTSCSKQHIMLNAISKDITIRAEQKMKERARPHPHDRHRSLVEFKGLPQIPRNLTLHIPTSGATSDIHLPLINDVSPTHKSTTKPLWNNVFIPVTPLGYITDNRQRRQADTLRPGWIYVFWNNQLWRELSIAKNLALKDVYVAHYRRSPSTQNQREADGHGLHAIWIPLILNGEQQTGLRMAYFPTPLSWQQIEHFENNPADLAEVSSLLDGISQYSNLQHFGNDQGDIGNLSDALLDQDIDETATGYHVKNPKGKQLRGFRDGGTAVAYLPLTTNTLRLKLRYSDGTACTNKTVQTNINGQVLSHTTDQDGLLEMNINKDTDMGNMHYWDGKDTTLPPSQTFEPNINDLDAVSLLSGVQARLNNMGYNAGPVDGLIGKKTRSATRDFQQDYQLSVDGDPGPQTQKMLLQEYGF